MRPCEVYTSLYMHQLAHSPSNSNHLQAWATKDAQKTLPLHEYKVAQSPDLALSRRAFQSFRGRVKRPVFLVVTPYLNVDFAGGRVCVAQM